MNSMINIPIFALALLLGMFLCFEVGRWLRRRRVARMTDNDNSGQAAVEGAIFALFGLMVAFSFSGAVSRYDVRRALVATEANYIGTAYLRIDLLAVTDQTAMRRLIKSYLDSRLEVYRSFPDIAAVESELRRSAVIQGEIWRLAVVASRSQEAHPDAGKLLLPAINDMIDISTTRTMAARSHPPLILFYLLLFLALVESIFVGFSMAASRKRSWLHPIGLVLVTTIVVYVIVDLEYPRVGLIQIGKYDQVLVDLRNSMK